MKKLFRFILPMLMAIIAIPAIQAKDKKSGRPSREQFAEVQAKKIAEDLKLDENTTKQFVVTFTQCQKEIWSSAPQKNTQKQRPKSIDDRSRSHPDYKGQVRASSKNQRDSGKIL